MLRGLAWAALGIVLAGAAGLLVTTAAGYRHYVITGGSMQTTIPRGSIVFDQSVPVESLRRGDVITYAPPASAGVNGLVTHRIVSMRRAADGATVFRTKGDANPARDPWHFSLHRPTQARVAFHVPVAGFVLAELSRPPVRFLLIGVPALLVALSLLAGLWEEAGREAKEASAL